MTHEAWSAVARAVGLAVVTSEPVVLRGTRRGVRVAVRTEAYGPPGAAPPREPTHTVALADVDPPLFAGLMMYSRDLTATFGVLHGASIVGPPDLDAAFVARAYDRSRVLDLFLGAAGGGSEQRRLTAGLVAAARGVSIILRDRSVEAVAQGASPDGGAPERVERIVDAASLVARHVSSLAERLPERPEEAAARERWQQIALALGLSFDRQRWHLYGRLDGVDVSVVLEGSPPAVATVFRARLPVPLACGMRLRRGYRQRVGFTTYQDGAPPGFPELDGLCVLEASDLPRARAFLAHPALRAAIAEEAKTSNIMMDDREITVGRGGFAGRGELRRRLEALRDIALRLTPATPRAGPFR